MKYLLLALAVTLAAVACRQKQDNSAAISFKTFFYPSFHEESAIELRRNGEKQEIVFVISNPRLGKDRELGTIAADTLYAKTIAISESQYKAFDSLVLQKAGVQQPEQWSGCCDGMPVVFTLMKDNDTSFLYFRNPNTIHPDSSGYIIAKAMLDQLRLVCRDSVILDYLQDVESYMDTAIRSTPALADRPINRLRRARHIRTE